MTRKKIPKQLVQAQVGALKHLVFVDFFFRFCCTVIVSIGAIIVQVRCIQLFETSSENLGARVTVPRNIYRYQSRNLMRLKFEMLRRYSHKDTDRIFLACMLNEIGKQKMKKTNSCP